MSGSLWKVVTIAQKEFADNLWNPVFLSLLVVFTWATFVFSYEYGMISIHLEQNTTGGFIQGFQRAARIMAWFTPLFGIGLSFDAIIKEEKSGSLNVLLGHPVYRDNIILGKLLGSMLTLFLALAASVIISVGTLMIITGEAATSLELTRIGLFLVLIFLYTLVFAGIGLMFSLIVKEASDSLIYIVIIWLVLVMVFFQIINALAFLSGQTLDWLFNISPMYHYAQTIAGTNNIGWGGAVTTSNIKGIFDTNFTFSQWLAEFWMSLMALIIMTAVLFSISFVLFLRKDITL